MNAGIVWRTSTNWWVQVDEVDLGADTQKAVMSGRQNKEKEKRTKNDKKIVRGIRHNNVQSGRIRDSIDKNRQRRKKREERKKGKN